jgi:hypothetical protein
VSAATKSHFVHFVFFVATSLGAIMENLLSDTRYAIRNLLRRPAFTLIAVVTLALGIGANTAIFSAINALLLKPLPIPELERVVAVWDKLPSRGVMHNEVTFANYLDLRTQNQSFEQLALYRWWSQILPVSNHPNDFRDSLLRQTSSTPSE